MKVIRNVFYWIVGIIVTYVVINLFVFIWDYIGAEGYWGFEYFRGIIAFGLMILLQIGGLVYVIYNRIIKQEKSEIPIWILLGLFIIGGGIDYVSFVWVSKKFNDRYRFVHQTEDYIKEGRKDKARKYAETTYKEAIDKSNISPFWIFKYGYYQSSFGQERLNNLLYQSTINYAYCLSSLQKERGLVDSLNHEALKLSKSKFSNFPEYQISPLFGLLMSAENGGEYQKMDGYYAELIAIENSIKNDDDVILVITGLFTHIYSLSSRGLVDDALALTKKSITLFEQSDENGHSTFYFQILLFYSQNLINNGELDEAKKYLDRASAFANKKTNREVYSSFLKIKALYYQGNGEYKAAEKFFLKSLRYIEKRQGQLGVNYAYRCAELAVLYLNQNKINQAENYISIAQSIVNQDNSLRFHKIKLIQAKIELLKGNKPKANLIAKSAEGFLLQEVQNRFLFLNEEEREAVVTKYSAISNQILSIYYENHDNKANELLFNFALNNKELATNNFTRIKKVISSSNVLKAEFDKIVALKDEVNQKTLNGDLLIEDGVLLQDSVSRIESGFIERVINSNPNLSASLQRRHWHDIAKSLNSNEVAIEFLRIPLEEGRTGKYIALLISKNHSQPKLIELCNEGDLEKQVKKIKNSNFDLSALYNLIWAPLELELKKSSTVYISKAAMLHNVPFAGFYIGKPYNVRAINSTSEISILKADSFPPNKKALLYGGICYNPQTIKDSLSENTIRQLSLNYLPNTLIEINNINSQLSQNNFKTEIKTGFDATSKSLLAELSKEFNIIHLATHGYYHPPNEAYKTSHLLTGSFSNTSNIDNPLFRSGLFFSSGINGLEQKTVVTALEISQTNLHSVQLVVLSACETGLGDLNNNQGIYGLQRAFKLAGAKSILMTLWKIDDEITSEFMIAFYKSYFEGLEYYQALKKAQREIKAKYPSPYYWAGFTLLE